MAFLTKNVITPDFCMVAISPGGLSVQLSLPKSNEEKLAFCFTTSLGRLENFRPPGIGTEVNCLKTSITSVVSKISVDITNSENSSGGINENRMSFNRSSPRTDLLFAPSTVILDSSHLFAAQQSTALNNGVSLTRQDDLWRKGSKYSCLRSKIDL